MLIDAKPRPLPDPELEPRDDPPRELLPELERLLPPCEPERLLLFEFEEDPPLRDDPPRDEELLLREDDEPLLREDDELPPRPPPCEALPPIAAISLTRRELMDAKPRPLPDPELEPRDDPPRELLPELERLLPPCEPDRPLLFELEEDPLRDDPPRDDELPPRPPPCEALPPIAAISLTRRELIEAKPRPLPDPELEPRDDPPRDDPPELESLRPPCERDPPRDEP